MSRTASIVGLSAALSAAAIFAADHPVAEQLRQQRPAGAPTIKNFAPPAQWRATALQGVSEPHPPSLRFLDHQGPWYTPFDRPGMPGPYDLRGWHVTADSGTKTR